MESFLAIYFEMGLNDCDMDIIDDVNVRIMSPGKFTLAASLNQFDSGILSSLTRVFTSDKWSARIINAEISYELRLDTSRYLTKQMDVEPDDILDSKKIHILTSKELAELIRCLLDPSYLRAQLQDIIPGYIPVKCQDEFVHAWRKEHPDSFYFVINILLRECFSGHQWVETMTQTLKPLPEFIISKLNSTMFSRICAGLNAIRDMIDKDSFDEEALYRTSWLGYEVLRCALLNFNVYSLVSVDSRSVIGIPDIGIYKVNYNNPAIYEQFDGLMAREGHMAYHGSSVMNWYSIIYNGLFVAKDSLIKNGAAYGIGIYLSNSSQFSLGYSAMHNVSNTSNMILGVFQVKNPLHTYLKTENIFVVPEESDVCLRYLIYMKRSVNGYNITNAMDCYFIRGEMVKEVSTAIAIMNKVWSRRVMSEIRELQGRDGIMGDDGLRYLVTTENGGDSMNIINLAICRDTFCDSPLGKDMDQMGIETIKMEVRLPGNYPFEPPFIRVLSPKFAFRKGHITVGGSVCIDLLTKQRWVPSLNIPNIMITIVQNMITGDGRLEPGGKNYVYSLKESQDAFTRMLSTHASEWA